MDDLDLKILKLLQDDVPITEKPFSELSQKLNISESELIRRIKLLKEDNYIFRIAPKVNFSKFTRISALVAIEAKEDGIEKLTELINSISEISHAYIRDNKYNLWITVSADNQDRFDHLIDELKKINGVTDIVIFPSKKIFKLNVKFEV
ncbi:MAG: AsnC family transcriptional regulator [Candidatus Thermoplasmatota archaeon]|jgi:DNA-binding Lrp family transcriptional regulator|nr:AsnC family transcriptional regulator [Candidatus Thermoplasmatota archaeon]MCL5963838.1 AsnC family transcriptional regulator [Candidatus Thermoplasmatota archaeon]